MATTPALILGGAGRLAQALSRALPGAVLLDRGALDVRHATRLKDWIQSVGPHAVYNCAAYNMVDQAEVERERCFEVNAIAPGRLARLCARHHVRFVHFSTNFVFDGSATEPYAEDDEPLPHGAYAISKRYGELEVLLASPDALVVRTSALYGVDPGTGSRRSFPERIVEQVRRGRPLRVVDDQFVNPTQVDDLAAACVALAAEGTSGLVHLVGEGCCSWYEFARQILRATGANAPLAPVSTAELAAPAPRPRNGCLRSKRVGALRGWRAALEDLARAYAAGTAQPRGGPT